MQRNPHISNSITRLGTSESRNTDKLILEKSDGKLSNKYGEPMERETPGRKSEEKEMISVSISKDLHTRIQKRLNKTEFATVDNYVEYVLQQVLVELESGDGTTKSKDEGAFSKEDQENVEQRLRNLGYI